MTTPVEHIAGLKIGTVESVSPSEIKVLLELDAPQATALNTGVPVGFPRINNYVLIPNESGAVVGLIVWIGIERSPFPKRHGLKDFDLVDLPFPLRKMALIPLGTIVRFRQKESNAYRLRLERGVTAFPSVGDSVLLPTSEQLRSVIDVEQTSRHVRIGTSPLAADAPIAVDPDKLFGRHLAVLGNTGSGKSCSVAGMIRWALERAEEERTAIGKDGPPNARFIILDPNGEYSAAFADMPGRVRRFCVPPAPADFSPLRVPAWLWSSQEWSGFASAQSQVQRPLLLQGLRDLRAGGQLVEMPAERMARTLRGYKSRLEQLLVQGVSAFQTYGPSYSFARLLNNLHDDAAQHVDAVVGPTGDALTSLCTSASQLAQQHHWQTNRGEGYNDFSETEVRSVLASVDSILGALPIALPGNIRSEDAPIRFDVENLPEHIEHLASESQSGTAAQFVSMLTMRIRMMLADTRKRPVFIPDQQPTLVEWLEEYIGADAAANGEIAILDLSLVPSDVLCTVIAVLGRLVFEAIQRYRRLNDKVLPTVLVLEEAHTFIPQSAGGAEDILSAAQMCRHTFERIAREGRKFGLGLVLSSQRPDELSPTVLAQCNTFLLHRIVNDRDQAMVRRLVPDRLAGLLQDLPNLPTRHAILLGWAVSIPVLVEMRDLPEKQRPQSADPDFWDVWTGRKERIVNWEQIAKDWQG